MEVNRGMLAKYVHNPRGPTYPPIVIRSAAAGVVLLLALMGMSCDRGPGSALKGQVNTTVVFHGLTVDQDGRPLPGVRVEYRVEAYPKDWTFETRDRPHDISTVSAVSDAAGRFTFTVT